MASRPQNPYAKRPRVHAGQPTGGPGISPAVPPAASNSGGGIGYRPPTRYGRPTQNGQIERYPGQPRQRPSTIANPYSRTPSSPGRRSTEHLQQPQHSGLQQNRMGSSVTAKRSVDHVELSVEDLSLPPHGSRAMPITIDEESRTKHDSQYPEASCQQSLPVRSHTSEQLHQTLPRSLRPPSWQTSSRPTSSSSATSNRLQPTTLSQGSPSRIRVPSNAVELPSEPKLPPELSYNVEDVKPVEDDYRKALLKYASVGATLKNGWKLYGHQKRAVLKSIFRRRMILALDMGLGKTLIGCVWANAFRQAYANCRVVVVCPVSLKEEWKRTAEKATALVLNDESAPSSKSNKRRRAEDVVDEASIGGTIYSWQKVPKSMDTNIEHFVVVCDEAHSMQSMTAARTKDVLKLVKDKRCVGVLLLTGTPMKNGKPANLFPLLKAVQHPLGRHQRSYETHFCGGREVNFGRGKVWQANAATNLKQLQRLVEPCLLHLTKEQCLNDLPALTRETKQVPVSSRSEIDYSKAVQELFHASEAAKKNKEGDEAVLGATQRLRLVCAFAKVAATIETAKQVLMKESAVVIFCNFVKCAKTIHDSLEKSGWPGELLTGETPAQKRQAMVDRFQQNLSAVFVCTFGAGGVGLTLTAAATVILLDRPWTPGETRQAEDRVRRIGQKKPVTSIWMSAFELDEQIDSLLESKNKTTEAVLANGSLPTSSSKISIQLLLSKLMAKK